MMKKRLNWIIALLVMIGVIVGLWSQNRTELWSPGTTVLAQEGVNLLTNGSLESPYYGQGGISTRTAPNGWNLWVGSGAPDAFPHNDKVQVLDGEVSWNIKQGYVAFTAAGYQRVTGMKEGDSVALTAFGWVYTCNDTEYSCIIPDPPYRQSDTSAGASLKVGIDPTGGTDPNSAAIKWSAATAPYDQWAEMSVGVTAEGSAVTVYLHMTQSAGLALNNVYWDNVSLVYTEIVPDATPTPAEVPFVVPQGVLPDGSIIHVVQAQDTMWSIAYAYAEYGVTRESIAELNEGLKPNSRFLQLGQEIVILPPGSVDPLTGQLRPPDAPTFTPIPTGEPASTEEAGDGGDGAGDGDGGAGGAAPLGEDITPEATEEPTEPAETPVPTVPSETLPLGGGEDATEAAPEDSTEEPTAEPTEEMTEEPTPEPTEEPAEEPTEPSPVEVAEAALPAETGTLCVAVYVDANQNRTRDADETTLPGAQIVLAQPDSPDMVTPYDGTTDPLCQELPPGRYDMSVVLPEGYGMTTDSAIMVNLTKGSALTWNFGGAAGFVPETAPEVAPEDQTTGDVTELGAIAPTVAPRQDDAAQDVVKVGAADDDQDKTVLERALGDLYDYAGLIVLGFAGLILVGSTVLLVTIRRFFR